MYDIYKIGSSNTSHISAWSTTERRAVSILLCSDLVLSCGATMFAAIGERMTKELGALVPSM